MTLPPTPGQTVGPFFAFGLEYVGGPDLVPDGHPGALRLGGRVLDGAGDPVPDALLELWQADPAGRVPRDSGSLHRDPDAFSGWGRCATDGQGRYAFRTIRPAPVETGGAAFFALTVFARGLLHRLLTRVYLPDDPGLATDPLLQGLAPARRDTLVATASADGGLDFDVRLQGEGETVFLRHSSRRLST